MTKLKSRRTFVAPIILAALIGLWVGLAPEEETLHNTIRWVYLHVAFTWAGTSLINLGGLVGLVLVVKPMPRVASWFYSLELVATVLFSTGFVLSLVSAWESWGGVLWQEPRVAASLLAIALGVSAVLVLRSLHSPRVIGLVAVAYSALMSFQLVATRVVFHPPNAIEASDSVSIRVTFYGLAILATALGVSLILLNGDRTVPMSAAAGQTDRNQ